MILLEFARLDFLVQKREHRERTPEGKFAACDRSLGCTECQTSDYCRKINGADQVILLLFTLVYSCLQMCSVNGCCVEDPQKGQTACARECHSHGHCEADDKETECNEGCCRWGQTA